MAILSVSKLCKSFGSNLVTNDVTVEFQEGELVSIIGANGAGKTTFFNLLTGMLKPNGGTVKYKGSDITGKSPNEILRYGLSRSFQVVQLFEEMNVLENVSIGVQSAMGLRSNIFKNFKRNEEIRAKSEEILYQIHLLEKRDSHVGAISHGDRKILDIGMALTSNPETLLLDEPMSGLAKSERTRMTTLINELKKSMTLIIVEHDMDVVFQISDKILVLHQGAVLAFDEPDAVASNKDVQAVYLKV